ncbi:glypican-5-like [Limulus polyphemus]|uniref:Glypican-5-like n=1 Tax=Limulus polyphemus TaxID=6850 RepID=A0ABM1BAU2_LIMPO|nr:glypican-5-like [Limulus polyphemus]
MELGISVFTWVLILFWFGEGCASKLPTSPGPLGSGISVAETATDCSQVRQLFKMKKLEQFHLVSDNLTQDNELKICSTANTCCSRELENRFITSAGEDFRLKIQTTSSSLKSLLKTTAIHLQENFIRMTRWSENNTKSLFGQVYQNLEPAAQFAVTQLYSDLMDFLRGKNVDLEVQLSDFFASLFPHIYRHGINSNVGDFGDEFVKCLRRVHADIKPFDEKPYRLALQVTRSFHDARTFLQALSLGLEVINTTDYKDLETECNKALVSMTYCAYCQNSMAEKPCTGYCLNVARGCLAQVAELDHPWSEFITGIELIISGMLDYHNIEKVLTMMDAKISESIMYAMEHGPEITTQVQQHCDNHRRSERSTQPTLAPPSQDSATPATTSSSFKPTLYQDLKTFVQKIAEFKGYYGYLADSVCDDRTWASRGEMNCWNGYNVGEYKKAIAGIGIGAQKYNPEFSTKVQRDVTISSLVDKLVNMRMLLDHQITRTPMAESLIVPETGSGDSSTIWKESGIQDDEDYYYHGSGSGYFRGMF